MPGGGAAGRGTLSGCSKTESCLTITSFAPCPSDDGTDGGAALAAMEEIVLVLHEVSQAPEGSRQGGCK